MIRRSVNALLLSMFGVVVLGLLLSVAVRLVDAWRVSTNAETTQILAQADRTLFSTLLSLRSQRSDAQTAMLTLDDPRAKLEDIRRISRDRASAVTKTLDQERVELGGEQTMVKDFLARWEKADSNFEPLFAEGAKPRAQRDPQRFAGWYESMGEVIGSISTLSTSIANTVRMTDPVIAEMVQVRQTVWQVRDYYGRQCSLLRPNVNSAKPLDEKQKLTLAELRTGSQTGWNSLDEILSRSGVSAIVSKAATDARSVYGQSMRRIAETVDRLDGSNRPLMPPPEWTRLCQEPFDAIVSVGLRALDETASRTDTLIADATWSLWVNALLLAVLIVGAITCVLVLQRRFHAPINQLLGCIHRLATGDYATPVERLAHDDEFGQLAAALESLRAGALEAKRLSAEQEARQAAELVRASKVDALCRSFDGMADRSLGTLGDGADSLRDTAIHMRELAKDASDEAGTVATAAEQATANVQTVAAATEQLTASISEISQRVQSSAVTARDAVEQATKTNATVEELNNSAQRIGEVVKLISSIASQTNLLALNATIEAARAGEAGKGFAVVAQEVKNLATQTANATEEITVQVTGIQATTGNTVDAIRFITRSITSIDEMASAIAAAVQQQGAATQEIARNVQRAAEGTQQVTTTIGAVAGVSRDTGGAAVEVLEHVERMVGDVGDLRREVGKFLDSLRAV